MHQEPPDPTPQDPKDNLYPLPRTPDSDSSDIANSADDHARYAPPWLNWQVVEIEGEATLIEETEIHDDALGDGVGPRAVESGELVAPPMHAAEEPYTAASITDQRDDVVVAWMQTRRVVVMPGETAKFDVTVANYGRWGALFEITVEGWIDEAWATELPVRVQLDPGISQMMTLRLSPPRQPESLAGERALAIVVRASRYPGRVTRLAATLVIERYASLKLGTLQPREAELSWFVSSATLRLPITNQSNYPATIHMQAVDRERQCDFAFYINGYTTGYASGRYTNDLGLDESGANVTLQPGQSVTVPIEVRTRQRPFLGLVPRLLPFRLSAHMDTEPPLRRAVDGHVTVAPLVGPWHMAVVALLGVLAIFGTGLAGLALLVALRSNLPAQNVSVAATAVPAAPVVAFVIQMDQPMPTRSPNEVMPNAPVESAPPVVSDTSNAQPAIPIVSADQVTAPGEPTPAGQPPLRPVVVTTPRSMGANAQASAPNSAPVQTTGANLTYGEMFKQVSMQYDLDWRILAAQAYLESGFDSLALSGQGDMGLMQIRPATWKEWAPTVDASDPFDSYSNVLVGATYLNYLRELLSARGYSQQEWMLVAYNWGPDKVLSHIAAGGTWESLDPARRQYAEDILRIAASIPSS